ncbi:RNA polymerase factor sigma-32 [Pseudoroseicyclus sp. H15]
MAVKDPDHDLKDEALRAEWLEAETEFDLARRWRDHRDEAALHRLTTAYLRLAISVASRYRRYGAPMSDLVQEASLGLMKAAEKFDPERGLRFSTYAIWWIRASVQDYVMRNWSLVRTGSTASQKSLFFNLRRVSAEIDADAASEGRQVSPNERADAIATALGVPKRDAEMMMGRLAGSDFSLNVAQGGDEDGGRDWIETIPSEGEDPETEVGGRQGLQALQRWLNGAMSDLSEREQFILRERRLSEDPRTLESLGEELGLSKERVRQLEAGAFGKMRRDLETKQPGLRELLH